MRGVRFSAAILSAMLCAGVVFPSVSRKERMDWAARADQKFREKNFNEAMSLYKKAINGSGRTESAPWKSALGRCYEAVKDFHQALNYYREVRDVQPKSVEVALDLARVYALSDINDKALEIYGEILKRDKNRRDVLWAHAALNVKAGRWAEARSSTEKYISLEPQDLAAQGLMAEIEEASGNPAAAAHRREGILARRPSAEGYFELGRLWAAQGQFDLAEESYRQASRLGMDSAEFYFHGGVIAWVKGNGAVASELWEKSLRKSPGFPAAVFFKSLAAAERGRTASARETMKNLAAAPDSVLKKLASDFMSGDGK